MEMSDRRDSTEAFHLPKTGMLRSIVFASIRIMVGPPVRAQGEARRALESEIEICDLTYPALKLCGKRNACLAVSR